MMKRTVTAVEETTGQIGTEVIAGGAVKMIGTGVTTTNEIAVMTAKGIVIAMMTAKGIEISAMTAKKIEIVTMAAREIIGEKANEGNRMLKEMVVLREAVVEDITVTIAGRDVVEMIAVEVKDVAGMTGETIGEAITEMMIALVIEIEKEIVRGRGPVVIGIAMAGDESHPKRDTTTVLTRVAVVGVLVTLMNLGGFLTNQRRLVRHRLAMLSR